MKRFSSFYQPSETRKTHLKAFMTKCSTSPTGNLVSLAIVSNLKVLSSLDLLKTLSIKAIKQIFCLKKEEFSAKIGIEPEPP